MRGPLTPAGQAAGTVAMLLLTLAGPALTAGLIGTVHASPVQAEEDAAPLTSDQVLRRVVAWLESEETQQRQQQQQRALDSLQEQMNSMALELERLETKLDIKIDRLQEVLIVRDIKEEQNSDRQGSKLNRTALLLTEVSDQLQRMDSHIKGSLDQMSQKIATIKGQQQQPTASDVTAERSSDVTPELRRLADGDERHDQRADLSRSDRTDRTDGEGETQRKTADGTEHHENGASGTPGDGGSETPGDGGSNGQRSSQTEGGGLYRQVIHRVGSSHFALKLLEDITQLKEIIIYVSDQLEEGLNWLDEQVGQKFKDGLNRLDKQVGRKFGNLKDDLATIAASLRKRFYERRDHLEEVATKIIALQTAAMDGQRRGDGGGEGMAAPTGSVITAVEAAIYDVIDTDLWYMLSTKLEKAVSSQGNMTVRIGKMESNMDQGFSKLYDLLTRLSDDLVKSAQDQTTQDLGASSRAQSETELRYMFGNITQHLHGIQLTLAGQQAT